MCVGQPEEFVATSGRMCSSSIYVHVYLYVCARERSCPHNQLGEFKPSSF